MQRSHSISRRNRENRGRTYPGDAASSPCLGRNAPLALRGTSCLIAAVVFGAFQALPGAPEPEVLSGTTRLEENTADFPGVIVNQWDAFLLGEIKRAAGERP